MCSNYGWVIREIGVYSEFNNIFSGISYHLTVDLDSGLYEDIKEYYE